MPQSQKDDLFDEMYAVIQAMVWEWADVKQRAIQVLAKVEQMKSRELSNT